MRLFLDELIRRDISGLAQSPQQAEKMRGLPTRQLIYYCVATRLASTLEHALQNSLYYSRVLAENPGREAIGGFIADLKKTAQLCLQNTAKSYALIETQFQNIITALPFTWPEELAREPESFLAVSHSQIEGLVSQSSSGTSGRDENRFKRIFCTRRDQEATIDFFASGMRYLVDPFQRRDKVAMLLSAGGRGGGNLADLFGAAMRRLGVPFMLPSDPIDERATLAELADFAPSCVIGTPRQLISLFRESADADMAKVKSGLKNILISGDRISSDLNDILHNELGAEIFLHYGMVESGIGTAVECQCRRGAHYRESDLFIEIIMPDGVSHPFPQPIRPTVYVDPDVLENGSIYGPTPWGEVTITTLSREGSPLIRYRTGDSGRIVVDRCACGSELWRLDVRGRLDDYIELPPGRRENTLKAPRIEYTGFEGCLYGLPWVKDYQVIIHTGKNETARDLGVSVLLNGLAPETDKEAASAIHAALAPVEARVLASGVNIHIRPVRDRKEFCGLFSYSPKRSFPRSQSPLDPAAYVS